MLPKTRAYVKTYDGQAKWMYFLIKDDALLQKYNIIWDKTSWYKKRECDNEPAYDQKIFKTEIKLHGAEVTDFHAKKTPKVRSNHTCFSVISLDSTFNKDGNYYPQVLLKECF